MAGQAFALSPISARAALPGDEDYDAIREAFMETARGRWFLDEYAKRNRNSDTRMVLDAVARIEETLASRRETPAAVAIDRLPGALAAIRGAVEIAQQSGLAAIDRLRLDETIAPIRKGARIIREISWRWREIGADGRICDLIDSQLAAIDSACGELVERDPGAALRAAFEAIRNEVEAFCDPDVTPPVAAKAAAPRGAEVVEFPIEPVTAAATVATEAASREPAATHQNDPTETAAAEMMSAEDADAQDEAVLDMVAFEMAASDPDDADDFPLPMSDAAPAAMTPPGEPVTSAAHIPEALPQALPQVVAPPEPAPPLQPAAVLPSEDEPSLGSALLASGIVTKSAAPAHDPLAPIRRMSQAEKIAFFS